MSIEALSGKVFLLITGASRGIGRQIAITFGSLLQEDSHILLLARSINSLQEIAKSIPSKVTVHTISMDLSKANKSDFQEAILESLKGTAREAFDRVVVVHNVGTIGACELLNQQSDMNDWQEFYNINFFLPIVLNTVIMNVFDSTNTKKVIINITSSSAIKPLIGYGQYCSVKAAREMYFKVFALENPNVNVLSYSPGPVDTDMFEMACEKTFDPETKKAFIKVRETTILTTEQTVNRLIQILKEQKYKSADHVDYYHEL